MAYSYPYNVNKQSHYVRSTVLVTDIFSTPLLFPYKDNNSAMHINAAILMPRSILE